MKQKNYLLRWLVCKTFRWVIFPTLGGIKPKNLKNIPKSGGLILAANHLSHLDPPAIAATSTRLLNFMAKEELFVSFFGRIIHALGAFPIRRGEADTTSIKNALKLLSEGGALLVFPEGTRGDGKTLKPFNSGVSILAKRSKATVLPVGIIGTDKILPRGSKKIKRNKVTVVFGEPFTYNETAIHESEALNREAFTKELRTRISNACQLQLHNLTQSVVPDSIWDQEIKSGLGH